MLLRSKLAALCAFATVVALALPIATSITTNNSGLALADSRDPGHAKGDRGK